MKIVTIVGARPQFIKAFPVSQALRQSYQEVLVHTGQHYDENMSRVFFSELGIPEPDYNLNIGSAPHGRQTGAMMDLIEQVLLDEKPAWVLLYGDTNSTLAGALTAAKLNIPIAHVEAGLRSFNKKMPEEINRIVADHLSSLLLCPSQTAANNLQAEGIQDGVHVIGDVMLDSLQAALEKNKNKITILNKLNLTPHDYYLATIHRAENTDRPERLLSIIEAFSALDRRVIIPLHPRTRKIFSAIGYNIAAHSNVIVIEPVGYLEMACLEQNAHFILTDSGGIQKEAYWLKVPCITLRDETEWVETVQLGWNILVGADTRRIVQSVDEFSTPDEHPQLYGDGQSSKRIVDLIGKWSEA